jgi:hypothetical protein
MSLVAYGEFYVVLLGLFWIILVYVVSILAIICLFVAIAESVAYNASGSILIGYLSVYPSPVVFLKLIINEFVKQI